MNPGEDWQVVDNGGKGELVGVKSNCSNWFVAEQVLKNHAVLIAMLPRIYRHFKLMDKVLSTKDISTGSILHKDIKELISEMHLANNTHTTRR